jgi:methanogenic corrinoid protein MtbC1
MGAAKKGKVLIGTVAGDIHDIGKDIVTFMLDVNGYYVRDNGIDVPVSIFVEKIKEFQPKVVGLSGFLTLALVAGLDAAILDPFDRELRGELLVAELVLGQDRYCFNYTRAYREGLIRPRMKP